MTRLPWQRCSSALCSRGSAAFLHTPDSRRLQRVNRDYYGFISLHLFRFSFLHKWDVNWQSKGLRWGVYSEAALTRWSDGTAAVSGQRSTRYGVTARVRRELRHGPDRMTAALIVHGHAVREGFAHRTVGLSVVAAHFSGPPAGVLQHTHTRQIHLTQHCCMMTLEDFRG